MDRRSRIAVVRCRSYDAGEVRAAIARAVDLLGGMGGFVVPGKAVLLKPNMLSPHPPEKAVTTHPAVVEAVIRCARDAGAFPEIGDSPGFHAFAKVATASGIGALAGETGVPLVPFDEEEEIRAPEGCLMKKFVVARTVVRAPVLISLPKFKTHNFTCITAAVKNIFGCIPGLKKAELHCRFPDRERFARMLADLGLSVPARLHILDAVVGMDGNGPGAGDPFPIGLIIAGADPVAVDSTACRVVGIDPLRVPMLRIAAERGLGNAREEEIDIRGEKLGDVRVSGFRAIPPEGRDGPPFMPAFVVWAIKGWFARRPRILRGECTRCGACVGVCPPSPKALTIEGGRVRVDRSRCILCYCCNEICPARAIRLRRGFGAGLLARMMGL
jgi:uncharacterized protein (DUF362 family)/Pyruvate/2-oxoacid:ferredoxin oxidoreductase delta subunit